MAAKKTAKKGSKKAGKKAAPKGKTTKKAAKPETGAKLGKADFIRENATLSAKEIVEKAKAAGLDVSPNYVYIIRSKANKHGSEKMTRVKRAGKTSARSSAHVLNGAHSANSENAIRGVISTFGTAAVKQVLEQIESEFPTS